ncbi:hypothetical protein PIB30_093923 [Stylosanthes scabra]|uniref:Uncharacterized protein n=1 Tax=Stylosanthes scabra TaxID=79078 RepID=A0ABU6UVF6_9FABA|nr:hypothetical protein [Stylosanthes scabra]
MKKESLRSKERSLEVILSKSPTDIRGSWRICVLQHKQTTPRHSLIKPRRGHYPCLSTHRRGSPRICVDQQPLAQEAPTPRPTPRRTPRSLGVALTFSTASRVHA